MITNERQYKITKFQYAKLLSAIDKFSIKDVTKRVGTYTLAKAELQALESESKILEDQLHEYEALQAGEIATLEASSLSELPILLIRARIAQHLTQKELADLLKLKEQQIQRYEADEYAGVSLRRLKEIAEALKLNIRETAEISLISKVEHPLESKELYWNKFPIREMYLRGWFEEFTGSLDEAIKNADILAHDFILTAPKKPVFEFFHKSIRSDLHSDEFALFVWEIRVLTLATRVKLSNKYLDQSLDSAWLSSLIKASSKEDGPIRIKAMLQEIGIPLIIEPHLTNTYLDGAALLGTESPVIGMTLRYDRLDNFWFVLFHEVSHIMMHLRKGKLETIFDDLDGKSRNRIEQEADLMAEDAMIPNEKWKEALPRYVRSPESIKDYAAELDINPAIIAGRIRYESNNYRILNDLIGQGMVRKNFPNIIFGA